MHESTFAEVTFSISLLVNTAVVLTACSVNADTLKVHFLNVLPIGKDSFIN